MSKNEPELTEVVAVAAQAAYERRVKELAENVGQDYADAVPAWDDLSPVQKRGLLQESLEWIYPVAQLLYDQGRRSAREETIGYD